MKNRNRYSIPMGAVQAIDLNVVGSSDSAVFQVSPQILPSSDRGSSDFDVRHSLNAATTYTLVARRNGRIAGRLMSQWTFGGIATARRVRLKRVVVCWSNSGFG